MRSTAERGREQGSILPAASPRGKPRPSPTSLFLLLDQLVVVGCFPIENSRLREREGEGVEKEVGRSWNLGMGRGRSGGRVAAGTAKGRAEKKIPPAKVNN